MDRNDVATLDPCREYFLTRRFPEYRVLYVILTEQEVKLVVGWRL